jgi:hypothetical protein
MTTSEQTKTSGRTRDEHLEWCKNNAYRYLREGNLVEAVTSMGSDMSKHPETGCNSYLLLLGGMYATEGNREAVRRWIEGFR